MNPSQIGRGPLNIPVLSLYPLCKEIVIGQNSYPKFVNFTSESGNNPLFALLYLIFTLITSWMKYSWVWKAISKPLHPISCI